MKIIKAIGLSILALFLTAQLAFAQFTDQRVWAGTSGGSANAQTLTVANMGTTPLVGVPIRFIPVATNTTAATIALNGGTPIAVFKPTAGGAVALTGGEIVSTPVAQVVEVIYDGTRFQIVANNVQSAAFRITPQGYLTPCNFANSPSVTGCAAGGYLPTGDVTGVSTLYYGTMVGNQLPIYNGSNMVVSTFSELTLSIPSSRLANTLYDVCVFNNAGTITAAIGPAWTTSTPGSGARGTGAGTAQITQVQGIWVNAVSISGVNGASTFSIAANQCTIVATLWIDNTAGQTSFTRTYGQNRKWGAWNFYNRLNLFLKAGDSGASWTYSSNTIRASNNTPSSYSANFYNVGSGTAVNGLSVLIGLPEEEVDVAFTQAVLNFSGTGSFAASGFAAIGVNSTTATSGLRGNVDVVVAASGTIRHLRRQTAPISGVAPSRGCCLLENGEDDARRHSRYSCFPSDLVGGCLGAKYDQSECSGSKQRLNISGRSREFRRRLQRHQQSYIDLSGGGCAEHSACWSILEKHRSLTSDNSAMDRSDLGAGRNI